MISVALGRPPAKPVTPGGPLVTNGTISMPSRSSVDFPFLLNMISDSFMSRPNTIVVPGSKMGFAMELILNPMIHELIEKKRKAK